MKTIGLWPTWVYETVIENHNEIYDNFKQYLEDEKNYFDEPWQYGSCLSSIRNKNNDQLPWKIWFDSIKKDTHNYLENMQAVTNFTISCDEHWVNIYKKHNYQETHDHSFPGRSISAIYILELEKEENSGGQLIFECPNYNIIQSTSMSEIFSQWQYQKYTPELEQGKLILFPCWLQHYVLPYKSENRRSTIAANFRIQKAK